MDIKLADCASNHSTVVFKSRQGWAWQRYFDLFDTLVIQQLDSVYDYQLLLTQLPST